jgi:hypothetical protein
MDLSLLNWNGARYWVRTSDPLRSRGKRGKLLGSDSECSGGIPAPGGTDALVAASMRQRVSCCVCIQVFFTAKPQRSRRDAEKNRESEDGRVK